MCDALRELFADELREREAIGVQTGQEGGRKHGKSEAICELLSELGPVPVSLQEQIFAQPNLETLSQWLKLAAKANSVDGFARQINV